MQMAGANGLKPILLALSFMSFLSRCRPSRSTCRRYRTSQSRFDGLHSPALTQAGQMLVWMATTSSGIRERTHGPT